MVSTLVERRHRFYALRSYLTEQQSRGQWEQKQIKIPNILLAQIRKLDREFVMQLEQLGIYDTTDFEQAGAQLLDHLHISKQQFKKSKSLINEHLQNLMDIPRIILDLPENYCLLSAATSKDELGLAVIWRGILFSWSCPRSEGWHLIKFTYDKYVEKMNHPEIIGSHAFYTDPPTWLETVSDISTYLSNLFPGEFIEQKVIQWGFPTHKPSDAIDLAEYQVLQLAYLLDLSVEYQCQIEKYS